MASLRIDLTSPGPSFFITSEPRMPEVKVQAVVEDVPPDALADVAYNWSVTISFDATKCPHGRPQNSATTTFTAQTNAAEFVPQFPQIRGGDLQIKVQATIAGQTLEAVTSGLKIGGTNPPIEDLREAIPEEALRRMLRQESGGRQFLAPAGGGQGMSPLFSGDNLGGVGLLQVTVPPPTQDEIWNWRANVAAARRLWAQKLSVAKAFPQRCRACDTYRQLAAAFNDGRRARGLAPLTLAIADFTDDQLQLDAIRGYNGYAGRDWLGLALHEFRLAVQDGALTVVDNHDGTGIVAWERVPAADRPHNAGDPRYVDNILRFEPI